MALGILAIMALVAVLLGFLAIGLLFSKQGKFMNNIFVFIGVQLYCVILSWLYITSLPSNFTFQRIIGIILLIISVGVVFLKKRNFKASRFTLAALVFILPIITFFI